ncbi:glycosyltransferase involved in cell wall biosynthesis [Terracoccus luteus]|uniref:Glycosyltransferase involved in cell wall biosynthesis n=1 Tax=Terracoccus luteus TaxID=53356 RepID=A0A495Y316_9MICO|nr:glycosyltransferase family 4 protein [Terracoccus luteus]RKT79774.1 glycosyltransferase involved in cell wall biosynthesis [Terracoccus luteus]
MTAPATPATPATPDGPASVVHVMGCLDVGGAERMLLQTTRRLVAEGHSRHTVVALSGRHGRLTGDFAAAGVPDVPCATTPWATFPVRLALTLRRLRPDVVVSHVSLASGLVLLVAAAVGVRRRVAVMHSDGDGRPGSRVRRAYRAVSRVLLRLGATTVVGVTPSTLAFSGRRPGPTAVVLPNAVDLTRFTPEDAGASRRALGLPSSGRVLLHVGRGSPEKNRAALVPLLRELDDDAVLLLAGAADAGDLGPVGDDVRHRVHDLGLLDDVRPAVAAADVLVLPSVREGLPLVVLEALAAGRPVVASDLPGIRAACGDLDGVTLVAPAAGPAAFAAAVRRTLDDAVPPDRVRATMVGSSHDLERVLEQWRRVCGASA